MLTILLFGVATMTLWGFADLFIAQSTRAVSPILAAALVNCLGLLLFSLYYVLMVRQPLAGDLTGIAWSLAGGVSLAVASACFFIAMHRGPVGICSAISGTYPAVTLLFALGVFHATVSTRQIIGVIVVMIGVSIAAGTHDSSVSGGSKSDAPQSSGLLAALLAACAWGVGYAMMAESVKLLGWQTATLLQTAVIASCYIVAALFFTSLRRQRSSVAVALKNPFILGATITQLGGALLLNMGLGLDSSGGSVVVALSACYPLLTIVLARFYLHERLKPIALAGGVIGIAGILTLTL